MTASAQSDPFLGEVKLVGYNFCPRGWAPAEGQLLPISQYTALFSLYGTYYGGDGRTTFGLPDLRGQIPVSTGTAPGLPERRQGSVAKFSSDGGGNATAGIVAMRWCVALEGIYPSRN